jgi:hypothetical protein
VNHGRTDGNQVSIVKTLLAFGASVQSLTSVGGGCPDLEVGWQGVNYLFEIKRDAKKKLLPSQIAWRNAWKGRVYRINNAFDALIIIGVGFDAAMRATGRK